MGERRVASATLSGAKRDPRNRLCQLTHAACKKGQPLDSKNHNPTQPDRVELRNIYSVSGSFPIQSPLGLHVSGRQHSTGCASFRGRIIGRKMHIPIIRHILVWPDSKEIKYSIVTKQKKETQLPDKTTTESTRQ